MLSQCHSGLWQAYSWNALVSQNMKRKKKFKWKVRSLQELGLRAMHISHSDQMSSSSVRHTALYSRYKEKRTNIAFVHEAWQEKQQKSQEPLICQTVVCLGLFSERVTWHCRCLQDQQRQSSQAQYHWAWRSLLPDPSRVKTLCSPHRQGGAPK